MSKVRIKFDTDNEEINKKVYEYSPELTMKELLESFLRETNSKTEAKVEDIQFIYKGKILNSPEFQEKKAKEIFRFQNHKVKVWDSKNIIGGMNNIFYFYL